MSGRVSSTIRFAAFYAALFSGLGVYLPYWALWLEERRLDPARIGVILSLPLVARSVAAPLAARLVDRTGRRALALRVLSLLAFASFLCWQPARTYPALLLVSLAFGFCFASLSPLADDLATRLSSTGLDYGRARLWGSLAFLLGALGAGRLLERSGPSVLHPVAAACIAACALSSFLLADEERAARPPAARRRPARKTPWRGIVLVLLASALVQGSHGAYYGFSSLAWARSGLGGDAIGLLWAEGVAAEILFFSMATRIERRFGPLRLVAAGGFVAALRWIGLAASAPLPALLLLQAGHAVSFGATHFACVHWIARRVSPASSATAQSLLGAATGLGVAGGTALAGPLFERSPSLAFGAMAVPALLGIAVGFAAHRALEAGKGVRGP